MFGVFGGGGSFFGEDFGGFGAVRVFSRGEDVVGGGWVTSLGLRRAFYCRCYLPLVVLVDVLGSGFHLIGQERNT